MALESLSRQGRSDPNCGSFRPGSGSRRRHLVIFRIRRPRLCICLARMSAQSAFAVELDCECADYLAWRGSGDSHPTAWRKKNVISHQAVGKYPRVGGGTLLEKEQAKLTC